MKVTVQAIMTSDSGATEVVHDVAHVERNTLQPETLGLTLAEAKFASLMSYGLTMKLLTEVLPMGREVNATTIRNHLQKVAQRCEDELGDEQAMFIEGCERDWEGLPRP
jgi:hypothetical protein